MNALPAAAESARFGFGRNWKRFLAGLNDERVRAAEQSLRAMLAVESLAGRSFLDIGSGSGLFSLAAMRLGAARVHSFDYDADSVECTRGLRERFFPDSSTWTVEQGSVLDESYMHGLRTWEIVYSWGVLHHTGQMHTAFDHAAAAVKDGGRLVIAIYNDQGWKSTAWWWVKRLYNTGLPGCALVLGAFIPCSVGGAFVLDVVRLRNPLARYFSHARGMSHIHDWVDWVGGFPFEVASREAIQSYFTPKGFQLERLISCGRKHGCNEFVLNKCALPS